MIMIYWPTSDLKSLLVDDSVYFCWFRVLFFFSFYFSLVFFLFFFPLSLFFFCFFFFFSSFFFFSCSCRTGTCFFGEGGDVNSLFCPAHGCTNSRFIIAELQIPRTREHVFLGSVWRAHWVQARAQQGRTRSDLTRRALIGFRGQWRGSCHGHKRRTSQSPLSCLLLLLLYCSVALLLFRPSELC